MAAVSPAGLQVTNENWQTPPHLAWAFQHIAELFPTAVISRGTGPVAPLAAAAGLAASTAALSQVVVTSPYDGTQVDRRGDHRHDLDRRLDRAARRGGCSPRTTAAA